MAETIEMPESLRRELACLSMELGETWQEVLAEALSELRTLYNVGCDNPVCVANEQESRPHVASQVPPLAV